MNPFERLLYDVLFSIALVAPLVAVALLALSLRRRSRTRRRVASCSVFLLATLAVNPVAQFFLLEPLDEHQGRVLTAEAKASGLVGMTTAQARALLGEPGSVHGLESGTVIWEYKQLPGYWLGSSFQVFIRDNAVAGFEANDD